MEFDKNYSSNINIDLSKLKSKSVELFCMTCSEDLHKCSHCKGYFSYTKYTENHGEYCLFRKEVMERKNCEFCLIVFDLDEITTHLLICEIKKINSIPCRFCKKAFLNSLMKEHEKSCEIIQNEMSLLREKVICEICLESVPLHHFLTHEQNCLKLKQQYKDLDAWARGKMDYPDDWEFDHEDYKTDLCMMPVDKYIHHAKYEFIEQMMINDMPQIKIKHIWRLQNKILWQMFYYEKLKLSKEKEKNCEDSWLFFGNYQHHPEKYFQLGFDVAFSSENGEVGKALYFYKNSDYVLRQKRSFMKDGSNFILLCKVLTGVPFIEKGSVKHRKTPFLNDNKLIYYDSITNHVPIDPEDLNYMQNKHNKELYNFYNQYFAVYDNNKAYPLYLIEFNEKKDDE